jgi:GMP synthase (glutamine-hydrolysing)
VIIIIDFGSQTTHLISRRIRDFGIEAEVIHPEDALITIKKTKPAGLILSGGPASVYEKNAPTVDLQIFKLGLPILGICYGWQLTAHLLGGEVKSGKQEYGPSTLKAVDFHDLLYGLPDESIVFESHGDTVFQVPKGFEILASTGHVEYAVVRHQTNPVFGLQFHPEMHHTEQGNHVLQNFVTRICNLGVSHKDVDVQAMIEELRYKIGDRKVIGAFSGGTDSAVAGVMVAHAVGKQFMPVYVDSGLMRADTLGRIQNNFPKYLNGTKVKVIKAKQEFLKKLKGVTDPEQKRKTIGKLYIDIFEREMANHEDVEFLLQGTTYADFVQAKGATKHSAHIKSHHNVGGLPKKMKFKLLEPLRYYYTDEVRKIGEKLGLPRDISHQQPFPGPGHAVRIVGEVTPKRLEQQILADQIVVDELKNLGWYDKVFQCCSVMTGANSTAVKGDGRFYGEVVALRIVQSEDRMTFDWSRLPHEVLARLSTRVVNEVPGISRVVYDITTKPPATMEWE